MSKKIFITGDEEWNASDRIGEEVGKYIESLELDMVNKEYALIVEVVEL